MSESKKMRNSFTLALEKNENIEESFRQLMHDTLDGLYSVMGQKNFLRWVSTKKISERIKKLIVEEFQEEDIKKYPNWAGYYSRGLNKEKLRSGYINKNIARHETLHFFTDHGATFPTFIDEGLTEYLNREFEKLETGKDDVRYTYVENVDFVEALHKLMGDSLIKAYLIGTSKEFDEEFSTYISDDGKPNSEGLQQFYSLLNRTHWILHPKKNPETPEEKAKYEDDKKRVEEEVYPELRQIVINIVANTIRKKAHNFEYYQDGSFNIEDVIYDINSLSERTLRLLGKHEAFGISQRDSRKEILEFRENLLKEALRAALQESHISDDTIIKNIVNDSISKRIYLR